ncbi:MAG: GMC family oxidoreductase N-terminal domain-containing protein [Verrucomicrobia bacterium]|nr:GMC family oxidoreductase N-terminal domain-containing protein [Verrucomicrobiota bacterium]
MFDYVIVGAGSAGCVLAHRLSANPATKVLLIEAGGSDAHPFVRIPAGFSKLFKTARDWNYHTEPQPGCAGRAMYWPRGKMLGGSSSINAMIYMRGHRADYDEWKALGNAGWGYDDLLPYFRKNENNQRGADKYHGESGPLCVTDLHGPHALSHAMVAGFAECGVPTTRDFNGATQEGAGINQVTMLDQRRWSAADAYLHQIRNRPNLRVVQQALVQRVVFDGRRATGVEYRERGGAVQTASAGREVLLCAGAIGSPQILLLSGVGPAAQLQGLGLPVVHDLPGVGENLQDHLISGVIMGVNRRDTLAKAESLGSLLRYFFRKQRGLLASNVAEVCAFLRTQPDLPAPDLQFHAAPGYFFNHGLGREKIHGASIGATLIRPYSVGRLTLKSTDPAAHPALDPRYLSDPRDLALLVEGLKLARRVFASAAFAPHRTVELKPGPDVRSDDEIAAAVRQTCETLYHPVGTCRMGPSGEKAAVVDPQLRVQGLAGLRVIDASIMPVIPRGNTNAPTMVIAEKAADLLLQA